MSKGAIKIDKRKAASLLGECVKERGENYVYDQPTEGENVNQCVYVNDGKPDCMIGLALFKAGVDIATLEKANDHGIIEDVVNCSTVLENVDITEGALNVFKRAQRAQDEAATWGHAYTKGTGEAWTI